MLKLEVMLKSDQLPGLQSATLEFYKQCLYGKQRRVSFLKDRYDMMTRPLELVHSNVFRPTELTSLGGASYFVTFLDDCTWKLWIYMMARKS